MELYYFTAFDKKDRPGRADNSVPTPETQSFGTTNHYKVSFRAPRQVADVMEGAGLRPFFDRSNLTEISMDALKTAVEQSACLVTIIVRPRAPAATWTVVSCVWNLVARSNVTDELRPRGVSSWQKP